MRIVSYNILDGGIGRADPIAEVLLAQRPDVVGLVEADDPDVLDRIAWRLGFDCIAAVGRKGRTAALLTRGRILESINHAARLAKTGPRSFLEASVDLDGVQMTFGVIHTTAKASERREKKREREVASVLEVFADRRAAGAPHVLMGDFNATSQIHRIERARLPDTSRKYFDRRGDLPRRAIGALLAARYLDTLAATQPGTAPTAASFTTLQPGQRVDFVFTFGLPQEAMTAAWVETDRLATYASDHYPVGAELRI